ncbi:MAG: YraN family protein [Phycisphaeraceae bacterium]|nr:YraN family protein [Phycisphaeraceae bacterium]
MRAAREGESAAAGFLERQGYRILARNLRVGRDELDLLAIAPDERTVVVVEVKCRRASSSRPEERVDHRKRHRLSRAALTLSQHREFAGARFRFDVISVVQMPGEPAIEHWPAAFDAE